MCNFNSSEQTREKYRKPKIQILKLKLSILFAYRNREKQRILNSLQSLQNQNENDFEVVFVDYGSNDAFASRIQKVVEGFSFASYHYIAHPGLLWNKSKALNYAASKAKGEFIFVADVDICFDSNAVPPC